MLDASIEDYVKGETMRRPRSIMYAFILLAFSTVEMNAIFEEADRDNDGALSQAEFSIAKVLLSESPENMPGG